jgi:hypothetical protein
MGKNIKMDLKKCPKCNSNDVARIVYGLPTEEAFKEADKRKIVFGGCCIDDSCPKWHCNQCGHDWGKAF